MSDVEALIAEVRGHLSIAFGPHDELVARQYRKDVPRLIAALEELVSAPKKDDALLIESCARLAQEISHSTPKSLEESRYDRSLMSRLADALSGRVSPVEHEYGEKFPSGAIVPHRSRIAAENSVDDWNVTATRLREQAKGRASYSGSRIVRRTAGVAPGSWELVPVGVDKP